MAERARRVAGPRARVPAERVARPPHAAHVDPGYAEAIADGTVDDQDAQLRAAEVIASESRRLERLVADLLDLARLDTHQFSLRPQPIDARAGRRGGGRRVPARRRRPRPRAGHATAGDGCPVDADPQRLAQIVANLVENALKYATAARRGVDRARPTTGSR